MIGPMATDSLENPLTRADARTLAAVPGERRLPDPVRFPRARAEATRRSYA